MKREFFLAPVFAALLFIAPHFAIAAEPSSDKAQEQAAQAPSSSPSKVSGYEYSSAGNRDPFTSLIQKKSGIKVKGRKPLESYDTADMKVIAILWMSNKYAAVLTMPDGKSYTAYEGDKVGPNGGAIRKITKNSVIIADRVKDSRGKLSAKERVLKLRVEEE